VAEISGGLAKLLALRLAQQPPEDAITKTLAVWVETICTGRVWSFERDAPRFRTAFQRLQEHRTTWPAPRDFLEALPRQITRVERSRLIGSDASFRTGQAHIRQIMSMFGACAGSTPAEEADHVAD
jgi:hypothetical protein